MSEVPYPMLVATNKRLEAENQRLREEIRLRSRRLHAAGDHLVRLDDEVTRLLAELLRTVEYLDPASRDLLAERNGWENEARNRQRCVAKLRAGIEKLRTDAGRYSPYVPSGWVARRLTELLKDERPPQADAGDTNKEDK